MYDNIDTEKRRKFIDFLRFLTIQKLKNITLVCDIILIWAIAKNSIENSSGRIFCFPNLYFGT